MEITACSREEIIQKCLKLAGGKTASSVVTLNSLMARVFWKNGEFREAVNKTALVICDSIGIQIMSLIGEGRMVHRCPGIEIMDEIVKRGVKSFFIGGDRGVAKRAAKNLSAKHPGANICAARHGYFKRHREGEIIREINEKTPQAVFIGIGIPRQELFINRIRNKIKKGLLMGVGGSFDVLSGDLPRAPGIFVYTGMEWFWRLLLQPARLGRILELPAFVLEAVWRFFYGKNILE